MTMPENQIEMPERLFISQANGTWSGEDGAPTLAEPVFEYVRADVVAKAAVELLASADDAKADSPA